MTISHILMTNNLEWFLAGFSNDWKFICPSFVHCVKICILFKCLSFVL